MKYQRYVKKIIYKFKKHKLLMILENYIQIMGSQTKQKNYYCNHIKLDYKYKNKIKIKMVKYKIKFKI